MKPATEPEKLNHLAGCKDGVGGGWVQPGVLEGKRDSSGFFKKKKKKQLKGNRRQEEKKKAMKRN